ncbi:hypothetical protein NLX83_36300 [Allokutzneria sp. A3M-2-11 16]|uniref:hypothetical protein n=1 Tax=Allokutzneria sp. A3M-2-11 16 TaxID=2962043 RepID=UPI0020B644C6|nr:hypothetical protein [Allokutzneria sp. A3M-2-11 16]MCP3804742.1 hypothetical protein [Allokutzneria sp. A3M-2-11 16]
MRSQIAQHAGFQGAFVAVHRRVELEDEVVVLGGVAFFVVVQANLASSMGSA